MTTTTTGADAVAHAEALADVAAFYAAKVEELEAFGCSHGTVRVMRRKAVAAAAAAGRAWNGAHHHEIPGQQTLC